MESCLITTVDLKKFTAISDNMDVELLQPFLLISQQLYVAPILGTALYEDIVSRYDNQTLTGESWTLFEEYITLFGSQTVFILGSSTTCAKNFGLHTNDGINDLNHSGVTLSLLVLYG